MKIDPYLQYFDLAKLKTIINDHKNKNHLILGIDFGTRKIGLAITDQSKKLTLPLQIYIRNNNIENDLTFFANLITQKKICAMVVGSALNETQTHFANFKLFQQSLIFLYKLQEILMQKIEFFFIDESFSSVDANQYLYSYGLSNKIQKKYEDQLAASSILEAALSEISY